MVSKTVSTLPRRALEAIRAPRPTRRRRARHDGQRRCGGHGCGNPTTARSRPIYRCRSSSRRAGHPRSGATEVRSRDRQTAGRSAAPIRDRYVQQNDQILATSTRGSTQTGAEAPNPRAVGSVGRLGAGEAGSVRTRRRSVPPTRPRIRLASWSSRVTLDSPVQHLNDSRRMPRRRRFSTWPGAAALQLGIASEDASGQLIPQPTTLKRAETFRRAISRATDHEATNVRQATIMKGLIDESTGRSGRKPVQASARHARPVRAELRRPREASPNCSRRAAGRPTAASHSRT